MLRCYNNPLNHHCWKKKRCCVITTTVSTIVAERWRGVIVAISFTIVIWKKERCCVDITTVSTVTTITTKREDYPTISKRKDQCLVKQKSRIFQWYKELFNSMSFDPYNRLLKIQESIETPTPKVRAHLGV